VIALPGVRCPVRQSALFPIRNPGAIIRTCTVFSRPKGKAGRFDGGPGISGGRRCRGSGSFGAGAAPGAAPGKKLTPRQGRLGWGRWTVHGGGATAMSARRVTDGGARRCSAPRGLSPTKGAGDVRLKAVKIHYSWAIFVVRGRGTGFFGSYAAGKGVDDARLAGGHGGVHVRGSLIDRQDVFFRFFGGSGRQGGQTPRRA